MRTLSMSLGAWLLLTTVRVCTVWSQARPSEVIARQTVELQIRKYSNGLFRLTRFTKTNGLNMEVMGIKVYQLEYTAEIQFTGFEGKAWWGGSSELQKRPFSATRVPPDTGPPWLQSQLGTLHWGERRMSSGDEIRFTGTLVFEMTENGWRLNDPLTNQQEVTYEVVRNGETQGSPGAVTPDARSNGSSVTPPADTTSTCGDYSGCFNAAMSAYKSRDWPSATAGFQSAANQRSTSPDPWVWLGRIVLQDGGSHTIEELAQLWGKALSLGADIVIEACRERTLQACQAGHLTLNARSIAFTANGSGPVFTASPKEITPGRIIENQFASYIVYRLKVGGKNNNLIFIPLRGACTFDVLVKCSREANDEQLFLSQYVTQALEELARGVSSSLADPASPSGRTSGPPQASGLDSSCAQAADPGYMILLQGRRYGVRSAGTGVRDRRLYFLDETGKQIRDMSVLAELASSVWTHDNVITSPVARNGSSRVSAILETSKALHTYSTVQDALVRAMVEAIQATATGGATLSKAVPSLTLGVLKTQVANAPRTLLVLLAHHGLNESLDAYRQMDATLPPLDATALDAAALASIRDLYVRARSSELPYEALAAKLMPTNWRDLTEDALRSGLSEVLSGPSFSGLPTEKVTLQQLLELQKGLGALNSLPALRAYSENLDLAIMLAYANSQTIAGWITGAAKVCN